MMEFISKHINGKVSTTSDVVKSHYSKVDNVIAEVVALCASRTVVTINPQSNGCKESYPCQGHGGAVITFSNGETATYDCSSVSLGIIMYHYGIKNTHFTNYVDDDLRKYIDSVSQFTSNQKLEPVITPSNDFNFALMHQFAQTRNVNTVFTASNILKSHYSEVENAINDMKALCGSRKVITIIPQSDECLESYPCQGHDGAVITFSNGETAKYDCSSVNLGIIMYYFHIDNDHFTSYVDADLRKHIDSLKRF